MPVPTQLVPTSPRFTLRTKPSAPLDAMTAAMRASPYTPVAPGKFHPPHVPSNPAKAVRRSSTETNPASPPLAPQSQSQSDAQCSCEPDDACASPTARARALAMGSAAPAPSGGFFPLPDPSKTHPENTTVFIGGLPPSVGRTELGALFEAFGEIIYINVPPGKGCGFVSFDTRQAAEWAIERMQGFWLRGAQLRLAWGRIQGDKPKAKSTTSNASDLSNSIKADLPFFAKMLDLSGEQQVKLGLYLEFANTGSLGRLRDILGIDTGSSAEMADDATSSSSVLGLALKPQPGTTGNFKPASTHHLSAQTGSRASSELAQTVDRLVDSPPSSVPSLVPARSYAPPPANHTSHPIPLPTSSESPSPKASDSSISIAHSHSYGPPSISDEAVFRAFHPTAADHQMQQRRQVGTRQAQHHHHHHGHHHEHGENCVTPTSLQKLAQMQAAQELHASYVPHAPRVAYDQSHLGHVTAAHGGYDMRSAGAAGCHMHEAQPPSQQAGAPVPAATSGYLGGLAAAAIDAQDIADRMSSMDIASYAPSAYAQPYSAHGTASGQPRLDIKASEWVPGGRWGLADTGLHSAGTGSVRW